jgi:hypothetical protein
MLPLLFEMRWKHSSHLPLKMLEHENKLCIAADIKSCLSRMVCLTDANGHVSHVQGIREMFPMDGVDAACTSKRVQQVVPMLDIYDTWETMDVLHVYFFNSTVLLILSLLGAGGGSASLSSPSYQSWSLCTSI